MSCFTTIIQRFTALRDFFYRQFTKLYFKNRHNTGKDVILFRILSIVVLLAYSIIDTVMYSSVTNQKSDVLRFLHGSRYVGLEMVVIIYSSGVAAFGTPIALYLFVPYIVVNCILLVRNCGDGPQIVTGIIWIVKILCLFLAIELCYRNFRKLPGYEANLNSATRAVLRQALLFSVTMLFLSSPGLRALYDAVNRNLPNLCAYATNQCGIIDLYQPRFSYNNDKCFEDLTAYVSGREQLRVLRNFILLNGVSYAVFNENFLEIHNDAKHVFIRILLVILYGTLTTSVLVSHIDPLIFINNCHFAYNIIECVLFIVMLGLTAYNLYDMNHQQQLNDLQPEQQLCDLSIEQQVSNMNKSPKILPAM